MEYSLTFVTLYLYLKDVIKTDQAIPFYSAISSIYVLMKISTGLLISPIFDRTRRLRLLMVVGNGVIALGNALYTIPLSPWFLFIGRLLSGSVFLRPIMTAEIIRSYAPKESLKKFSVFGITYGLGVIMGPAINFFFAHSNFIFLDVRIGYANGAAFLMTFVFILMSVLSIFCVSDLSKEFDLKEYLRLNEDSFDEEDQEPGQSERNNGKSLGSENPEKPFTIAEDSGKLTKSDSESKVGVIDTDFSEHDIQDLESFDEETAFGEESDETESLIKNESNESHDIDLNSFNGSIKVFIKLLTNSDSACILLFSLYFCVCLVSSDIWIPMVCKYILKWGIVEINGTILGIGLSVACAML